MLKSAQIITPQTVGIKKARSVWKKLPVSFFIVSRVVEQGQ